MKKLMMLTVTVLVVLPTYSYALDAHMQYLAKKKTDSGRMFVYQCNTGNVIEVEQRYNPNSRAEEIRFIINHLPGEWITDRITGDLFNYFSQKACEQSTTARVARE